jgi:hypothetical protein
MATEVRHGLTPKWSKKAQPIGQGQYRVTIAGHYTVTDKLAAAGVESVQWVSDRAIKRRGELLAMRSAFVCWFVQQYMELGGSFRDAKKALAGYPFTRVLVGRRRFGRPEVSGKATVKPVKRRQVDH